MKKEISPAAIIGAIVGLAVVIALAIFFTVKSDPASQAPHDPPRFDAGAKAAESRSDPHLNRVAPGQGAPR